MEGGQPTSIDDILAQLRLFADYLREFGATDEEIENALVGGEPQRALLETVVRRSAKDRSLSPADITAMGGYPPESLCELMESFGLPAPSLDERAFTPEEAEALVMLWKLRETWPHEVAIQLGRVYGRLMSRIAHSSVQLWVSMLEPILREHPGDYGLLLDRMAALEKLVPIADVVLAAVHRRWLEREFTQVAYREAPAASGVPGSPAAIEVSFLFCDLKDFTAYADRAGDTAAVRIIDQFAAVVTRERGHEARLTKLLGDGFMIVYPSPQLAVEAGARIIAGMAAVQGDPGVHASVHHGLAIPREGDYFGAAVNLTARLLGRADRDELVATRVVAEACPGLDWEPVGTMQVRGIAGEVKAFRLKHAGRRPGPSAEF
jgi:class 3 adenylate cyclase